MSRIGKLPISVPNGVKINILTDKSVYGGQKLLVTGPKGELSLDLRPEVSLVEEGENMAVVPSSDANKKYQGLYRTLINNAVVGVSAGYTKELEIVGIGYKAESTSKGIKLNIGYTHPVEIEMPAGIKIEVTDNVNVKVSGHDKQLVGEMAARIRRVRKPEPYKGKGIKYKDETIKRKAGKAAS